MIQRTRDQAARLMQKGLGRNVAMAVTQAGIGIVALFVSYRTVVAWHGTAMLGLWSLIGAFTLSIRMLDPSGGATIGRFIAIAADRREGSARGASPAQYADTALVLLVGLYAVLSMLAWYPLSLVLRSQIVDPAGLAVALDLLPVMLGLVVAMTIGASCADALDGLNRADLRAGVMIAGYLLFLALVLALVPRFGLMGMATAQLAQYVLVAGVARILACRYIDGLVLLPMTFDRSVAREMVGYGMKLQTASLANFLADPLVRVLLNYFGGLTVVGAYELASKLVVQIRSLIVSGAMPLIPVLAVTRTLNEIKAIQLVRRANRGVAALAVVMAVTSLVATPVLSWFVLGRVDPVVMTLSVLLVAGYAVNILSLPLYLHSQAVGQLKGNILGQFAIGATTMTLGLPLATVLGPTAVVGAFAIGLGVASAIFIAASLRTNGIAWRQIW